MSAIGDAAKELIAASAKLDRALNERRHELTKLVQVHVGLPELFREWVLARGEGSRHIAEHPKPLDECTPEEKEAWSKICTRTYDAEQRILTFARAFVESEAVQPEKDSLDCPRCGGDGEVVYGPDGSSLLGSHACPVCRGSGLSGEGERELRVSTSTVSERQDERGAS